MNDRARIAAITLSIAAVERDTGLSKDTLRVWERRYGFPSPDRDELGERAYTLDQIEKLRLIKRLMDAGHRPGRVVPLPVAQLKALSDSTVAQAPQPDPALPRGDLHEYLALIRSHDALALRNALKLRMARFGVGRFVTEVLSPLNTAVGDAWIRGQMEIFEEHVYTQIVEVVLRQGIAAIPDIPASGRPNVLLTTFPGEPHGLGLLMAEALFRVEGAPCISLGVQTPLWDIVQAANAHRSDIVGLSFTGCMNPNQVVNGLTELREKLPSHVQIWAGGMAPVLYRRQVPGVQAIPAIGDIVAEVRRWRSSAT